MPDLPERPDYDDSDRVDEYGLVMPFTCVTSKGGPYDDVAFVAGFQVGWIDQRLADRTVLAMTDMVYVPLEGQLDLVAMRHGYRMDVLARVDGGDWLHVGFTRVEEPPL